jgi:hypothetical protein
MFSVDEACFLRRRLFLALIEHAHSAPAQLLDHAAMRNGSPDHWRESRRTLAFNLG